MPPAFIQLSRFADRLHRLALADEDLRALEEMLAEQPEVGAVIPGTGGLRKVRFAPPSMRRGKRGGTRVCYAYFQIGHLFYLFTIYAKNQSDDLSAAEKREYRELLGALKGREA